MVSAGSSQIAPDSLLPNFLPVALLTINGNVRAWTAFGAYGGQGRRRKYSCPLVGAAELQVAAIIFKETEIVVTLQQSIAEFRVADAAAVGAEARRDEIPLDQGCH